jgi:dTDP-4-dehydrorhamnose reductase
VTGAGGLLGGRLAALLHERGHEVVAVHGRRPPPAGPRAVAADLGDPAALEAVVDACAPSAVVHAAVLSRADECEARPAEAERLNAFLPGAVARVCAARALRLVALSTDLVFAGESAFSGPEAPTGPLSVYGRTKRDGERAVLEALPGAVVARVALVVGRGHGPRATSSESVAQALRAGRPQTLFTDEFRTPVDPESVADAVARLLAGTGSGIYHLGGPERLSRYELGLRVARAFGLPTDGLVPALQREHRGPERRAPDVSLDSGRARLELGWEPRPLDAALRESRLEG